MSRVLKSIFLISLVLFFCSTFVFAEEITITTYYPSPYGVYQELRSKRLAIGDNYITSGTYDWEVADGDGGEIDYLADLVVEGNVGIGTPNPLTKLQVVGSAPIISVKDSSVGGVEAIVQAFNNAEAVFGTTSTVPISFVTASTTRATILNNGNFGIGTTNPLGRLDVNGTIFQRGISLHADYVFKPGYKLESIDEHAKYMWQEKHLKAVPKGKKDGQGQDIVEIGAMNKGVLEELEKAHVYIQQLNDRIKLLEKKLSKIKYR